ncbi:hypothetical protein BDN71DRAFT_1066030 [Pleurotus eryngii]|uniref:HNH nuclease domain-containing protein n=1 Tax=Pleurotus eryngii TaxID=5323 RepID=A0A9P5ZTT8_PLEER|nr:hypothetical protein BDN71DRAFT_1066030 [Pleurotus eryngii]
MCAGGQGLQLTWFTSLTCTSTMTSTINLLIEPRKWLRFVAYVACNVEGELFKLDAVQGKVECHMDDSVMGGDSYIFVPDGDIEFIDPETRNHAIHSNASSVRTASREQIVEYYRGCPFSQLFPGLCNVCHLVPHSKGAQYLETILRGAGHQPIDIDDPGNLILVNLFYHRTFDQYALGFLKTPNKYLDTTDIHIGPHIGSDTYCVTTHAFVEGYESLHNQCSDLAHGSGLPGYTPFQSSSVSSRSTDDVTPTALQSSEGAGTPSRPLGIEPESPGLKPLDFLLHITYISNIISTFGEAGRESFDPFIARHRPLLYNYGDKQRPADEEARARKRDRRHREEEEGQSSLDMILGLHLFFRGSSIAEEEKRQKEMEERAKLEAQESSKQAVKAWLEQTDP